MSKEQKIILGLRFSKVGRIYHFDADDVKDIGIGDSAVVETSRGWQIGQVVEILTGEEIASSGGSSSYKLITRKATPADLLLRQSWQKKEDEVVEACRKHISQSKFDDIKIVAAEYSFDGRNLTILFSSETEEKVDLKLLKKTILDLYPDIRLDLRQIGPRDVAKILEGMGACGLEKRCCSQFMTEFNSISIRMAKQQGISLTPSEITGMCGRLRCCLNYEHVQYSEALKGMPKRNKRVITPLGEGKVVDLLPLKGTVYVYIPDVGRREFTKDEVQLKSAVEQKKSNPQNQKKQNTQNE